MWYNKQLAEYAWRGMNSITKMEDSYFVAQRLHQCKEFFGRTEVGKYEGKKKGKKEGKRKERKTKKRK